METTPPEPQRHPVPFLDLVCAVAALAELWDREADAAGDVCRVPAVPPMVLDAARMHADVQYGLVPWWLHGDAVRDVDVAAQELFTHAPASWRGPVPDRSYVRGSGLPRQLLGVLAGDRLPSLSDAPLAFVTALDCRDPDLYSPSELAECARAAMCAMCGDDCSLPRGSREVAVHTAFEVFARTHDTGNAAIDEGAPCSCGSASRRNTRCLACATRAIVAAQRLGCVRHHTHTLGWFDPFFGSRKRVDLRAVAEPAFARMQQQEPWEGLESVEFDAVWSHLTCAVALACCTGSLASALRRATDHCDPLVWRAAVELAAVLEPDAAAAGLSRRDADVPTGEWTPGPVVWLDMATYTHLTAPVVTYPYHTAAAMDRATSPATPPTAQCNVVRRAARNMQRDAARPTLRRLKRDLTAAPTPRQRHRGR